MLVLKSDLFIEFEFAYPCSDISSIYNPLVKFSKMLLSYLSLGTAERLMNAVQKYISPFSINNLRLFSYLILSMMYYVNFPGSIGHRTKAEYSSLLHLT